MITIKIQVETEKVEALMLLLNESGLVSDVEVVEPTTNISSSEAVIPDVVVPVIAPAVVTPTPAPVVEEVKMPEIKVELADFEDNTLRPMTATEFYKKVNASNLAQKEKRLFSQNFIEKEVASW